MITVCGEALVDLVHSGGSLYRALPGGSPLNVAVAVARLGNPVSLLARIGHDTFGQLLREHLDHAGVSDRDLVDAAEPTTLAVASLDPHGRATYDFYTQGSANWQWRPADLPDPLPDDVTALHAGSLASWMPPGDQAIEALLRREHDRGRITISFDPNIRPALIGDRHAARTRTERLVGLATVVKASDEDMTWLYPDRDPLRTAQQWCRLGPRLVAVTYGGRGAAALTATGHQVVRPAPEVEVIDTVGAGDAFTAGLLTGLAGLGALGGDPRRALDDLDEPTLAHLLDRAGQVAGLTCTRPGATPPTRAELDHLDARTTPPTRPDR